LPAVVIETYDGVAVILIPQLFFVVGSAPILSGSVNDPLLRLEVVTNVVAPLFAPLAALVCILRVPSLRAQGGAQPPASIGTSSEEAGPSGLEYSRLDDASTG
jgi:hypothetical protein